MKLENRVAKTIIIQIIQNMFKTNALLKQLNNNNFKNVRDCLTTFNKPFNISIEGNIGCGKSTLLKYFNKFSSIKTTSEPIENWRNLNGHNILHLLYKDLTRWNFTFEYFVQLTRLKIQTLNIKENVHMFERSLQNNRYCFVEMSYKSKLLTNAEYVILCEWYDWIEKNIDIDLDLIVYLRCDPEIAYQRLKQRNRSEETSIPLEYLCELHNAYEDWLIHSKVNKAPVLILDVNKDFKELNKQYDMIKEHLLYKNILH